MASASQLPHERRGAQRQRSVLAIGKITLGQREIFCLVRDMSEGGLRIDTAYALETGCPLIVEMRGLDPCSATVSWRVGQTAGLAFDEPQNVELLALNVPDQHGRVARAPRFLVNRVAQLRIGSADLAADVINVSAGGARLRVVQRARLEGPGILLVAGMPDPFAGYVRWTMDSDLGFRFAPVIDRKSLMQLIG